VSAPLGLFAAVGNPSIEGGCEDSVLKDELYDAVMRTFRERLDRRGVRENGK
jgi:hypothetical protein